MTIQFPLPLDHFSGGGNLTGDAAEDLIRAINVLASRPSITPVTDDLTVLLAHELTIIEADPAAGDGSIVIYLPADLPVEFIVTVRQISAGVVTLVGSGGATVNAFGDPSPPTLAGQWAQVTAEVRDTDTWLVDGRLA